MRPALVSGIVTWVSVKALHAREDYVHNWRRKYQTVYNKSTVLNFFKFPNLTAMRSPGLFPKKSDGDEVGLSSSFQSFVHKNLIGHFRNELGGGGGGPGTPQLLMGSLPGTLFAYLATVPEVFAKVNSFLFHSRVKSGKRDSTTPGHWDP